MGCLLRSHALTAKLARFGVVGVMSGFVFLVCTAVLAGFLNLEPKIASAVGYIVSMLPNFLGNRQFSFKSKGKLLDELPRYLVLHGCNFLFTIGLMGTAVNIFHLHFGFGEIAATILVPLVNFAAMNQWVFRRGANCSPELMSQ
jgi:putative flippase GtrA